MKASILLTICGFLAFSWMASSQTPAATNAAAADPCSALRQIDSARFANPRTQITSAAKNAAGAAKGKAPAAPEHCEVLGKINERGGVNGQQYAIRFHLRLPVAWNGNFFFEGGGGSNGNLGAAFGNLQGGQPGNALQLGYAVVSQDSGHDNAVNSDPARNGTVTFGFDPQARVDFGYNSYDQVTQAAKFLVQAYYGRAPQRSYYVGCSEGGREGMVVSQRFPAHFDGVLACAPGLNLQKAAVYGHSWDVQSFAEVSAATGIFDRFGQPLLNKTFTDEDLDLAVQAILGACDSLDSLEDGIVDNFPACTAAVVGPKLAAITCMGAKRTTCLSAVQVTAIQKVYAGGKDAQGRLLYSDWAFDRGLGGKLGNGYNQGWRSWKIGAYDAPNNGAIIATLGSASAAALFTTPPTEVASAGAPPVAFLRAVDVQTVGAKITATSGEYTTAVADFMRASSTDLAAFKNRGSKLVIVQGVSDPVFSINDTIRWWEDLNRVNNGGAAEFARMFAVPGMNHCGGGPATDQFDAFAALVNWVEKSTAPAQIVATAGAATPFPGRTRPLCAYPAQARYNGSGSIEDARNFSCR
ncbi:MAG: tannase/feruloyl esterase family alpha/beta hydrolase [Acidobacteriota bacterium]